MKRFQFQLESVLGYKQQVLDELMVELSARKAEADRQELVRAGAQRRFTDYGREYEEKKREGLTVTDALKYQGCLDALERKLRREEEELARLRALEEEKRQEVVTARQEHFSLEKLKDMRRREHDAAAAKEEERLIDDLTISRRVMAERESA